MKTFNILVSMVSLAIFCMIGDSFAYRGKWIGVVTDGDDKVISLGFGDVFRKRPEGEINGTLFVIKGPKNSRNRFFLVHDGYFYKSDAVVEIKRRREICYKIFLQEPKTMEAYGVIELSSAGRLLYPQGERGVPQYKTRKWVQGKSSSLSSAKIKVDLSRGIVRTMGDEELLAGAIKNVGFKVEVGSTLGQAAQFSYIAVLSPPQPETPVVPREDFGSRKKKPQVLDLKGLLNSEKWGKPLSEEELRKELFKGKRRL